MYILLNMKEFEMSALSDIHNFTDVVFSELTGNM